MLPTNQENHRGFLTSDKTSHSVQISLLVTDYVWLVIESPTVSQCTLRCVTGSSSSTFDIITDPI